MAQIKAGPVDSVAFSINKGSVATAKTDLDGITNVLGSTYKKLVDGFQVNQVGDATAFELSDETLGMAAGYDKNCLTRHQLNFTLYNPNPWLLLNDAQLGNTQVSCQVRWSDGSTSTWNDGTVTVTPILNPIPNLAKVYFSASNSASHSVLPGGSWTDIGTVLEDEGSNVTPNTVEDGQGRQLYASTSLEHNVGLNFGEWLAGTATVDPATIDDGAPHSVAFRTPDDKYFSYNNVYVEVRRNNVVGLESLRTTLWRIKKGAADFSSILTLEGQGAITGSVGSKTHSGATEPSIADCLFGLNVTVVCSGLSESDFYLEG
jgi:hypothetical protein